MTIVDEVDVVIIGAGLSGLSAAIELKKRNISFVVLEARQRLGGRILSYKADADVTVDLGAQWIGKDHYHMKELLSQFGLKTVKTYGKGKTVYHWKGKITASHIPPLSISGIVDLLQFTKKLNNISQQINPYTPWESPIAKDIDKYTMERFLYENMFTTSGRKYYKFLLAKMLCAHSHEVSALDVLWCIRTAGSVQRIRDSESAWIKDGAGTLIQKMAEQINPKIYYQNPVNTITYNNHSAVVYTTEDQCWKSKRVILAIPPNLQSRIAFDPPLPALRAQLIERVGLPSVTKIILIYERPFWREKGLSGVIYSESSLISETIDSSPEDSRRGVLTVLVTGESARKPNISTEKVVAALVQFLGLEAAKPLQVFQENWSDQPWTRGGYGVHFAPGVLTSFGSVLLKPIASLHWAGTETATKWRLFMEGAVQSGERVAKEVIACLNSIRE